jgi:hypothetical protein
MKKAIFYFSVLALLIVSEANQFAQEPLPLLTRCLKLQNRPKP